MKMILMIPKKVFNYTIFSILFFAQFSLYAAEDKKVSFADYVTQLKIEAVAKGIPEKLANDAFANVKFLKKSVTSDKNQPEFKMTLDTYIPRAVPQWKVKQARDMFEKHYVLLHKVGKAYGVQPRFIVALWGIETNFGRLTGKYYVISALTTMAYEGRREKLFKEQLFAALNILKEKHITQDKFIGSWAGAMGQVQFMPTSFLNYAVDFDNDGKKDIWNSYPDVFASAANYLKTEGWNGSQTWGRQIRIPSDFDKNLSGIKNKKSLNEWQALGVRRFDKRDLPNVKLDASVVMPDDASGRVYLAYNNYKVLMHWNRSYYFASAVTYLSEKINQPRINPPSVIEEK